jgi:hypothetical protein
MCLSWAALPQVLVALIKWSGASFARAGRDSHTCHRALMILLSGAPAMAKSSALTRVRYALRSPRSASGRPPEELNGKSLITAQTPLGCPRNAEAIGYSYG